jgi:hypothetical protein
VDEHDRVAPLISVGLVIDDENAPDCDGDARQAT